MNNHVKTDIFPHNDYSAAEVQRSASCSLAHTKPKLLRPILRHKEVQAKCPYPFNNLPYPTINP